VCYYEPFDGAENKTFGAPQRQRLENNLVWWFNANALIGDSSYGGKRVYSNSSMEIIIESPIKDIWTISAEVRRIWGIIIQQPFMYITQMTIWKVGRFLIKYR